jgi:hypothetical protein
MDDWEQYVNDIFKEDMEGNDKDGSNDDDRASTMTLLSLAKAWKEIDSNILSTNGMPALPDLNLKDLPNALLLKHIIQSYITAHYCKSSYIHSRYIY